MAESAVDLKMISKWLAYRTIYQSKIKKVSLVIQRGMFQCFSFPSPSLPSTYLTTPKMMFSQLTNMCMNGRPKLSNGQRGLAGLLFVY